MEYTRTLTAVEELLLKTEGFTAEIVINNAIDYAIRKQLEMVSPVAQKAIFDGKVTPPAVMNHEEALKAFLKSSEFQTVNEIVAAREIKQADAESNALQAEIFAEPNAGKKAEKQDRKDAALQRKAGHQADLVAEQAEKAALLSRL